MTLQEILSANRELVINNYNSNIQLRNYTQMSLRDYMLGVMAWFADHSGSARKVAASTAADFKAPARVAIYDGRVEVERYNIGC